MTKKVTHEEYICKLKNANPNIEVVDTYINANTKIMHRCKICGNEWLAKPSGIIWGYGCPKCAGVERLAQNEYVQRVKKINESIEVLGEYINANTKILHKCKLCNHEWFVNPSDILNGHGCPVCSNKTIGSPPEYRNSIWSSEYKDYYAKYMTEEQMKMYMPKSSKRVIVTCPDCGRKKEIIVQSLLKNGLGCICGDGFSYPNKFMYAMLEQLNIEFISEYSPKWANKKQYDIYIPSVNCIIENNGAQHYSDGWYKGQHVDITKNDEYKKAMAKENQIQNYIIIDCRKSKKDWIKKRNIKQCASEYSLFFRK